MKTIRKSLDILDLFLKAGNDLSLDEVSKLSGINKSTSRRIVVCLMEYDFVKQSRKRGKYSLGMKFLDFSRSIKKHIPVVEIAEPYLTKLSKKVDETASLAVWNGRRAIICLSVEPDHPLKVSTNDGTMFDLHQTSLGKAILAMLPEEKLSVLIGQNLHRYTPNTITDGDDLRRQLRNIQREGVAVDDEEGYAGVRGIACPFRNEMNLVAGAVTILGPTVRLTRQKVVEYSPVVKDCASGISKALGCKTLS